MDMHGYDPRFGPVGYQPVEFLDDTGIADRLETEASWDDDEVVLDPLSQRV
jgi:hypothetical protein